MPFRIYSGGRKPPHPDDTHPRAWVQDVWDTAALESSVAPADSDDWGSAVPLDQWGMDGNDAVGDCGLAGLDHWQMAVTSRIEGRWSAWGTDGCLQLYGILGGYVPGDPSTDNGTVLQDNLNFWRHNPIAGVELLGYAALRPGSWTRAVRTGMMQVAGPLYKGLTLQEDQEQQFPEAWHWVPGGVIAGGHCTIQVAELHGPDEAEDVSWGAGVRCNTQFIADATEEMWILFTEQSVDAAGRNPYGYSLADMNARIAALTSERNPLRLTSIYPAGGAPVSEQTIQSGDQVEITKAEPEPEAEGTPDVATAGDAIEVDKVSAADEDEASATQPVPPEPEPEPEPQNAPEPPPVALAHPGVSNQGPALPASAQAAAARAHQVLDKIITIAQNVQADLERYVPADLLSAAENEAKQFLRDVL